MRRIFRAKRSVWALSIAAAFLVVGIGLGELSAFGAPNETGASDARQIAMAGGATEGGRQIAEVAAAAGLPTDRWAVADVADAVGPAVVYIEVEYKTPERAQTYQVPDAWNPWNGFPFGDFFAPFPFQHPGPDGPQAEPPSSLGSGVIFRDDGYILTNQHVVSGERGEIDSIKVTLLGRDEPLAAEVVGADRQLDLAVLKLEGDGPFPVAELGNSDDVRVGEWLVAIGNPYQYDHTVTVGVLSARGRKIQIPQRTDNGRIQLHEYTNLMQTDAAINPGNSGGPLVNLDGEVVGVNTAVNAEAQGIGFAIPINVAKDIVDELIEKGKVVRPFIGIEYRDVAQEEADYFGLPDTNGVMVANVLSNTAAADAGLQPGDVIREVEGEPVAGSDEFLKAIEGIDVGDDMSFLVMRRGRLMVIEVTVGERPADL